MGAYTSLNDEYIETYSNGVVSICARPKQAGPLTIQNGWLIACHAPCGPAGILVGGECSDCKFACTQPWTQLGCEYNVKAKDMPLSLEEWVAAWLGTTADRVTVSINE